MEPFINRAFARMKVDDFAMMMVRGLCRSGPRVRPQARRHGHQDNLSSHKRADVRALIEAAGARLMFLPPYSPDFNPIEKAFSRLKATLRKAGERTVSGPWSLIGKLVDLFLPQECANYVASCG